MSQINPFSGYIAGGSLVHHQQAADKAQQIRRQQDLEKDAALDDEQLEHQVESAREESAIHPDQDGDHPSRQRRQNPQKPSDDDSLPRLDVKA